MRVRASEEMKTVGYKDDIADIVVAKQGQHIAFLVNNPIDTILMGVLSVGVNLAGKLRAGPNEIQEERAANYVERVWLRDKQCARSAQMESAGMRILKRERNERCQCRLVASA